MEIDYLRPIRNVSLMYRWAVLQADSVIYIDDSKSASVSGTGLEDYFNFAHGFAGVENTTYSFFGVHHSGPRRVEPLTWHCYRQHVLDPVTFRSSLRFVMEGTDSEHFTDPVRPLTYTEHHDRLAAGLGSLAHVALYYFRPHSSIASYSHCDRIEFSNEISESSHSYELVRSANPGLSGRTFAVANRRYFGDVIKNQTFEVRGRSFKPGDIFRFALTVPHAKNSNLLSLRRTFKWTVREWNSRCRWSINGDSCGIWFVPMGSLSDEYSLQTDEVSLLEKPGSSRVVISIEPLSNSWNDISYELCSFG